MCRTGTVVNNHLLHTGNLQVFSPPTQREGNYVR